MQWGKAQFGNAQWGGTILEINLGLTTLEYQDQAIDVTATGSVAIDLGVTTLEYQDQAVTVEATGSASLPLTVETIEYQDQALTFAKVINLGTTTLEYQDQGVTFDAGSTIQANNKTVQLTIYTIESDFTGHRITTQASRQVRDELVSAFADQAGQVDRLTLSDGSFEAFDRTGDGTLTTDIDIDEQPPYDKDTYYVRGFDSQPLGQSNNRFEITLDVVRDASKETTNTVSQSRASDEWEFAFSNDTVVEDTVQIESTGSNTEHSLKITTSDEQFVRTVLENPTYQDGVKDWPVPDGKDFADDTSSGDRQTVDITPEDAQHVREQIPSGTYIITGWQVQKDNPAFWEIDLSVKQPETP